MAECAWWLKTSRTTLTADQSPTSFMSSRVANPFSEIRVAINMESFARLVRSGEMDAVSCIRMCKELGVDAIELMDMLLSDADFPGIVEALHETGLTTCCYDIHCDFVDEDPFVRAGQIAKVRVGLQRAAKLGSPLLLVIPGVIRNGIALEQAQAWYVAALKESMPAADHLGIRLLVE